MSSAGKPTEPLRSGAGNWVSTSNSTTLHDGDVILDRFKIVRMLGSGGMGDVYEAFDTELQQTVALKTIRPEIARNDAIIARFKKEVQFARRLSGPNICRIHELFVPKGDDGLSGGAFLTMELLKGITLAEKLQGGVPGWREAEAIALDLCAGLSTMHDAGIIHRDLKSRNIMLADRGGVTRAVIMDFGLAREIAAPSEMAETGLTLPGAVLGTPEFMAPEQFEGRAATAETDVYALGIVLYEMTTGRHPFAAANALGAAVLRGKRPEPVSSVNHGVPHRWDAVVGKCLEFEPGQRYHSAAELADALRGKRLRTETFTSRWFRALISGFGIISILMCLLFIPGVRERLRGMLLSSHEKHIAVLPLEIMGSNEQTAVLGDGLVESMSGKLSNLDSSNASLWVVPASEVRRRKVHDPSGAWREFGATIVVTGSFERDGGEARLKLTLIDPRKMREIGYVDVGTQTGDLASMEDEAVIRLGRLMNISVDGESAQGGSEPSTHAAYEDYLAGIGYFERNDKPGNLELAITSLQKALKTDPSFALGYARLAQVYTTKYLMTSDSHWLHLAEENGKRAVRLDDRIPATYVALGQVHELTGNHDLAIQEFQRAISLDARDAEALSGIANSYKNAGRNEDAEAFYIKAAALRPNDWKGYNDLGNFYEDIGRPRDAITQFNRSLELTPDNAWLYGNLALAYMDFDDPEMLNKAENALKRSIELSPTFAAYSNLGFLYMQQRRFAESVAATEKALKLNDQSYQVWDNLIAGYEWLKDNQKANAARAKTIDLLERKLELNSQDAAAQAKLAALYAKNGARERAVERINIALALSPDNQYVLSQIADAYELLGDRTRAIQTLQHALKSGMSRSSLSEDPEIQDLIRDPRFKTPGA
jgi:eukaryotic-like serine/threonine-protein kinase